MTDENRDCDEIAREVEAENAAEKPDSAKRSQLVKEAVRAGCVEHIPDDWGLDNG